MKTECEMIAEDEYVNSYCVDYAAASQLFYCCIPPHPPAVLFLSPAERMKKIAKLYLVGFCVHVFWSQRSVEAGERERVSS